MGAGLSVSFIVVCICPFLIFPPSTREVHHNLQVWGSSIIPSTTHTTPAPCCYLNTVVFRQHPLVHVSFVFQFRFILLLKKNTHARLLFHISLYYIFLLRSCIIFFLLLRLTLLSSSFFLSYLLRLFAPPSPLPSHTLLCPQLTLCGWEDAKVQLLTNILLLLVLWLQSLTTLFVLDWFCPQSAP